MNNTLKYKGFYASVVFSDEDNILFGKIEGIDDLIRFEGSSVSELKKMFKEDLFFLKHFNKSLNSISNSFFVFS